MSCHDGESSFFDLSASCPCGCKKSAPASSWYFGLTKCDTGKNTAQDWLDTFKTKELVKAVKAKAAPKKKSAESSSKSSTPTKDGDNADKPDNADDANNAASDEEVKEKKSAKKQKVEKEPKTPKAKKEAKSDDEKKPLSSYFIFCAAKRAEAKEVADSKPCTAAGLSEMWKNTSEEDRKPFQDQVLYTHTHTRTNAYMFCVLLTTRADTRMPNLTCAFNRLTSSRPHTTPKRSPPSLRKRKPPKQANP